MSRKPRKPDSGASVPARPKRSCGDARPTSDRRIWLFRLATVIVAPLLFLGLLELGLRAVGYGYDPHVTVQCRIDGKPYRGDNVKFAWRFFPPILAREFEPFAFPAQKPPNTCRIFVLGSSAAQGIPNNAFCFGRFLKVMLEERFPGVHFEVITTGMAAINSHVVLGDRQGMCPVRPGPVRRLYGQQRGRRPLRAGHGADARSVEPARDPFWNCLAGHEDRPVGNRPVRLAWTGPGRPSILAGHGDVPGPAGAGGRSAAGGDLRPSPPEPGGYLPSGRRGRCRHRPVHSRHESEGLSPLCVAASAGLDAPAAEALGGTLQAGRRNPGPEQERRSYRLLPASRRNR